MSALRDAIRLLFILDAGSVRVSEPDADGVVAVFKSEARLHAFDFWVRYPDYLADEVLNLYEASGERALLDEVDRMFREEEPVLRKIPMVRYKFGAWEKVDTAISVLAARRLVKRVELRVGVQVQETQFHLFEAAIELARSIEADFPALRWYAQRAALVARVAGGDGGGALKARQYRRIEYGSTPLGGTIPSIKAPVLARFDALRRRAA